ncbi:MAG: cellulase family glycosylhydrolase, partial [Cohnella sp.]|nr:cellulase family glycosylhydrolase [Cohnella sp.]
VEICFQAASNLRSTPSWSDSILPIYFAMLAELNDSFYGIVRESGGNNGRRPLVLSTLTASPTQARLDELSKTIKKLDDPNLIATIHYYGFYPFSVNVGGSVSFDDTARSDLEQAFDRAYETFVANGIPVIVGEFGLLGFDKYVGTIERGEVLKYLEYLTYYGQRKKFALMLWDNGQHFDRNALAWRNPDFYEVMNKGLASRSSNAESDTVFVRRGEETRDVPIRLILNGNSLVEIRDSDRVLTAGTDYELDGELLTLRAELMKSLIKDGLGANAALTLIFSSGANWKLHIVHYDTPKLSSAKGIRSSFDIPAMFNGDRLATMEADYAAGGHAGPDGWTAYKEFGKSFKPNDDGTLVTLTKEFFEQVQDGEVLLKLHFWSGEVVEYRLTVEGNKVSGVSTDEEVAAGTPVVDNASPAPTSSATPASKPPKAEESGADKGATASNAMVYVAGGIVAAAVAMAIAEALRSRRRGRSR